jgi:hypothetical protein
MIDVRSSMVCKPNWSSQRKSRSTAARSPPRRAVRGHGPSQMSRTAVNCPLHEYANGPTGLAISMHDRFVDLDQAVRPDAGAGGRPQPRTGGRRRGSDAISATAAADLGLAAAEPA